MILSAEKAGGKRDLTLAVVGAGRWGGTLMRAISDRPGLALAAVISSKAPEAGPDHTSAPVFATWQEAAETIAIDGFVLALPPDRQPDVAEQVIAGGFPVFLEKPLALHRDAAMRLLAAGRQFGFTGVIDHIHLFSAEFAELVRRLPADGSARTIETVSGNKGPFRDRWTSCWDWAPHDIAMSLAVMGGSPDTVTARIVRSFKENDRIFENYEINLDFGERGLTRITTGNAFEGACREFRVRNGDISLIYAESADRVRSLIRESGGQAESVAVDSVPPLDVVLDVFAERIRRKAGGMDDLELGVRVVNICVAAHAAIRSGGTEPVPGY